MFGATCRIPIQAIPSILAEGAKEAIKHFYDRNEYVQLKHCLASNPMVYFPNGNGAEDLTVYEPDEDALH